MDDSLKSPRGCPDWMPADYYLAENIIKKAQFTTELFGYLGYKTPIFEHAGVFTKSLGDSSDIITKEMYSFKDKNDETFVLRPEATAPIVRLFLSHKLNRELPLKVFTHGPMFRYERPQKGRQRQFHQIGVEHLGAEKNLTSEFELISMADQFLKSLHLKSKTKVLINSLGDADQRKEYKSALLKYLNPLKEKLSEDSQKRLQTNPLRILDTKNKDDQKILEKAPKLYEFLLEDQKNHLDALIKKLNHYNIETVLDHNLVRGMDYYNDTVFEIISLEGLGAQNTLIAGGRYDHLIGSMSKTNVNALGWGAGLERLMLLSENVTPPAPDVGLVFIDEEGDESLKISHTIRQASLSLYTPTTGNFSKRLQKCQKKNVKWAIIIGEDELKSKTWTLKNFSNGEQSTQSLEESLKILKNE